MQIEKLIVNKKVQKIKFPTGQKSEKYKVRDDINQLKCFHSYKYVTSEKILYKSIL